MHVRSVPGKSPHFLRKYFSKSLSFGLCVLRGRQVVSVVVLNTCLSVVLLSNAREGGWGRGVPNNGKRSYITRQKESRLTAKGVPIDGKRSPIATHKRSPLSLKEESRWPPWDSVLKRSPMAICDRTLCLCTLPLL